ncbi:protein mono-ADP-ribosyltransferase PARP11-like [Harmonia axyridis]|uniref:protein mono-ADP-ribosyltransferase PARP11-like n=1 Tax=Harmonia axyridis TaxID=115357 RepID=UPI001E277333|nr:protein mono-ADP-ribosyltransferase PARP11-like [Harmonia axyridis]
MFSTRNDYFDQEYYPEAIPIEILTETEHTLSPTVEWLGFVNEGKPYKLVEENLWGTKAVKIIHPYLERAFKLKQTKTGLGTRRLYHGTLSSNIDSILLNNFNWRLAGRSRGVKHGKGVCFSPRKDFARKFCEGNDGIIILTRILCRLAVEGFLGDILPRSNADTTQSRNGNVYVKFEDNDFLPLYIIDMNAYSEMVDLCSIFSSLKINF